MRILLVLLYILSDAKCLLSKDENGELSFKGHSMILEILNSKNDLFTYTEKAQICDKIQVVVKLKGDNLYSITNSTVRDISHCQNVQEIFSWHDAHGESEISQENLKHFQFLKLILRRRKERTKGIYDRKICCAMPKSASLCVPDVKVLKIFGEYLQDISSLCDIFYVLDSSTLDQASLVVARGNNRQKRGAGSGDDKSDIANKEKESRAKDEEVSKDKRESAGGTKEIIKGRTNVRTEKKQARGKIVYIYINGMDQRYNSTDIKMFQEKMSILYSKQPVWAMMCVVFIILLTMFMVVWTGICDNCNKNRQYIDYVDHLQLAYVKDVVRSKYEFLDLLRKWKREKRRQRRIPRCIITDDIEENIPYDQTS